MHDCYHLSRLPQGEKKAYKVLYQGLSAMAKEIYLPAQCSVTIEELLQAIKLDTPQFFYVDFDGFQERLTAFHRTVRPAYYYSRQQTAVLQQKLQQSASAILKGVAGSTAWAKALVLHRILVQTIRYDFVAAQALAIYKQKSNTILGPLLYRCAVCEGIALTVKLLLNALGIPCAVLYGKADYDRLSSETDLHAWNVLQANGYAGHLDVTWDILLSSESFIRHDYYFLTDEQIQQDHTLSDSHPLCQATGWDYYTRQKLICTDEHTLFHILSRTVQQGMRTVAFRIGDLFLQRPDTLMQAALPILRQLLPSAPQITLSVLQNENQHIMQLDF